MARAFFRHIALTLSAGTLLMGCVEGGGKGASKGAGAGLAAPAAARGAAQEVEAPDVFQTTDSGLWDGRPSLGGIWVASPDAKDPERVVMFNPATGKTVTGALFRRERDNPGPKLQVSSDAAEALGMLAGQPTEIRVTALRKIEVAEAAPAEPGSADAAATGGKSAPDAAETAALATAALGAADAPAATAPAAVAGEAAVEPATPEAPKRKTWKERRAEAKARREAEKAAKAAAAAGAAGAAAVVDPAAGAAAAVVDPAAGAVVAIETAPLDARSAEVAAPEPEKKKTRRQIKAEQEAAAAAAAAAAETPAAPEAPAATAGARPILIASFSKEDNAKRAAEALAKIGITARTEKSDRDGKAVWGVVASGDAALLDKIKAAGFADAYFLK